MDRDKLEEIKARLKDRYTAPEICEILGLTEDDVLEMWEEKVMELPPDAVR